jgi:hypothetical protein
MTSENGRPPESDDGRALAGALVEVLAGALPHLLTEVGDAGAAERADRPEERDLDAAKALWGPLRPRLEARIAAREAAQDLAEGPEDPDRRAALRSQLRKILSSNQALTEQLAAILRSLAPSVAYPASAHSGGIAPGERPVAAGAGGTAVGGNVRDIVHTEASLRSGGHLVVAESGATVVIGEAPVPVTLLDREVRRTCSPAPRPAPLGRTLTGPTV